MSYDWYSIDMLEEHPEAVKLRAFRDDNVDVLARTIADTDYIQPLVVLRTREGALTVVDGITRLRALRFLGLSMVPCVVVREERIDRPIREFIILLNTAQASYGTISRLRTVERLVGDGYTVERACKLVGKNRAWYYRWRHLLRAPERVQREIEHGIAPMPREGENEEIVSHSETRKRRYGRGYRRGGGVSEKVICPVCGAKLVGDAERHWQAFCPGHWREVRFLRKTTRRDTLVGGKVVFQCPRCRYEMIRP